MTMLPTGVKVHLAFGYTDRRHDLVRFGRPIPAVLPPSSPSLAGTGGHRPPPSAGRTPAPVPTQAASSLQRPPVLGLALPALAALS
nr:hypothetical protein [Nitrosomonas nitrosa]